jgi:hypothetical protein
VTGIATGTVKLNTGQPCAGTMVMMLTGGMTDSTRTDANGVFRKEVQVGEGKIAVVGAYIQPITIREGETSAVDFVLTPDHGVMVKVTVPS